MFKLKQSDTYWWPVNVEIPVDGGKYLKASFEAEFKRLPKDESRELMTDVFEDRVNDEDFFREVFLGFRGVEDAEGNVLENNERNRAVLCNDMYAARGIVRAYFDSIQGEKGRRKN